jgi:archaellum component FlaC
MILTDVESQVNNLKQELQIKTTDIRRFTERIDYLERDLQQVRIIGQVK